jgi:hypothetical protein
VFLVAVVVRVTLLPVRVSELGTATRILLHNFPRAWETDIL